MNGHRQRSVTISCASSAFVDLRRQASTPCSPIRLTSGNVQYGELMDFCYVWLRRMVSRSADGFDRESSRDSEELTVNQTEGRGLNHFTEGLAAVYANMARALKPGAPLAFTYHHNKLEAYQAIAVAILDAGLTCSGRDPLSRRNGGLDPHPRHRIVHR